jgi:hypothetical protein
MATLTRGQTFTSTDTVTHTKLHALVDSGTVSAIVNADIDASAAIADTKLAQISTAGKVSGAALTGLASIPSGAGVIPAANVPLPVKATGAEIDTGTDDAKFATAKAIADSGLPFETAWTDYSATSTIVGWTSFTTKKIYTKKIGKTVFVQYNIVGTSNATTTSFTVPYATADIMHITDSIGYTADNGTQETNGSIDIPNNSSVVGCYRTPASSAWTASGSKVCAGQFSYEVA